MHKEIDLNFRPSTYFGPQSLEAHLMGQVKGAVIRSILKSANIDDTSANVVEDLQDVIQHSETLGRLHPAFMGGNYLPNALPGEVEVARISIESTTYDVTCVYARFENGLIHYRVVDEYEGGTLNETSALVSKQPVTLQDLATYFIHTWPLIDVLKNNFEDDLDAALNFFDAESPFYPELDDLLRLMVIHAFPEQSDEEDDAESDKQ